MRLTILYLWRIPLIIWWNRLIMPLFRKSNGGTFALATVIIKCRNHVKDFSFMHNHLRLVIFPRKVADWYVNKKCLARVRLAHWLKFEFLFYIARGMWPSTQLGFENRRLWSVWRWRLELRHNRRPFSHIDVNPSSPSSSSSPSPPSPAAVGIPMGSRAALDPLSSLMRWRYNWRKCAPILNAGSCIDSTWRACFLPFWIGGSIFH